MQLPNIGNPTPYQLFVWDGTKFVFASNLNAGQVYNFAGSGVSEFEVLGIAASLNLDPLNTSAFIAQLTFEGPGNFTGTITAFTSNNLSATPLPGTLVMFGSGLIGLGAFARRRKGKTATTLAVA